MDQHDLNREVAAATGESTATIEALGFSLLTPLPPFDHRRHVRQQFSRQRGKGVSRTPSRPKKKSGRRVRAYPPVISGTPIGTDAVVGIATA